MNISGKIDSAWSFYGKFWLLLALAVGACRGYAAGLMSEGNPDEVVFKLKVDETPIRYITGTYGDEGCAVRIFELLDILGYIYEAEWGEHRFTGYLPEAGKEYCIDRDSIVFTGGAARFSSGTQWSSAHDLFVNIEFLNEIYGLTIEVNLNELLIKVRTDESAPYRQQAGKTKEKIAFEEQQRRLALENVHAFRRRLFNVNAVGYSILPMLNFGDDTEWNWNARASLNGELLRGSFYLNYQYSGSSGVRKWHDRLRFNWANTDVGTKWVKTILADHDYPSLTTTTRGYATSVTVSNTNRKSMLDRVYTFEGKTRPGAEVELFNNGELIGYTTADSLGHFNAEVAVSNRENKITARSYDAHGMLISSEKMVYLPAGLLRRGEFIYKFTTGITDYGDYFIAPTLEYGATPWATFSLGNETVCGKDRTTSIVQMGSKLAFYNKYRLDLKYIPTVLFRTRLYGNIIPALGASVLYEHYNRDQRVVATPVRDYLQTDISGILPKFIRGNYTLGMSYYNYGSSDLLSAYAGINIWKNQFVGSLFINTMSDLRATSGTAYSLRSGYYFRGGWYAELVCEYQSNGQAFNLRSQVNYQFKNKLTAFAETSYNFGYRQFFMNVGVVWRISFMRARAGVSTTGRNSSVYTELSGSMLIHDWKNASFSEGISGGASLKVVLFVDVNGNGVYDKREPVIKKPKTVIRTAAVEQNTFDGVLYTDIPSNVPFTLLVPGQKLGDISWQLADYEINLSLSEYQTRTIYIPVSVLTEVAGDLYTNIRGERRGIANMCIVITNTANGKKTTVHCDEWGTFIHMGLTCGTYIIDVHPDYLKQMKLRKANPGQQYTLVIEHTVEGKQLVGFDFELVSEIKHLTNH